VGLRQGTRDRGAGTRIRRLSAALVAAATVTTVAGPTVVAHAAGATPKQRLAAAVEADLRAHPEIPGEAVSVRAPGLAVAVARGDADVATRTPLTVDTPFRIASVTKTFVAAAVLRLAEAGAIELDAPVARALSPDTVALLAGDGYRPDRITVRQLLDHTSGLFDYATTTAYDDRNTTDPTHRWTRDEQVRFAMDHGAPLAAPGVSFHYSDTGYVLLGEILERATGTDLASALRRTIGFDRLGLDHTYWEILESPPPGEPARAHQYYDRTYDNIGLDASHDLYGGGGLVSTVGDVTRFFAALFDGRVFTRAGTLDTMRTVSRPGRADGAALGLFRYEIAGEECWGHPGYWGTVAYACPDLDLAFTIETNQANDAAIDTTTMERTVVRLTRSRH
jgi:D-alanyl-D-alanine carboxypeptidase